MSLGSPNRKRASRQSPQKRKLSITFCLNARYQLGKLSDNVETVNDYFNFSEHLVPNGTGVFNGSLFLPIFRP